MKTNNDRFENDNDDGDLKLGAKLFIDFCSKKQLVGFSFPRLVRNKLGKKIAVGMPQDRDNEITQETWKDFVFDKDSGFAVITGECSAITVIDIDSEIHYQSLIVDHPELKDSFTVKTENGYHIYCKYNPEILTSVRACNEHYYDVVMKNGKDTKQCKIDIRNDGGIVFAPPTKNYKVITDLPFAMVPESFIAKLKQTKEKPKQETTEPLIIKTCPEKIATFKHLFQLIDKTKRLANHDDWVAMGFIIYNEIGIFDNQAGLDLYKSLCDPQYVEQCNVTWTSFKFKIQLNAKSIASLIAWAKEDTLYPKLFEKPLKKYIFNEPFTFTTEQLIQKATTQLNNYDDILAERRALENKLPIYDPACDVLGSIAAEWAQKVTDTAEVIKTIKNYTAFIAQAKPVLIVKVIDAENRMDWKVVTLPAWRSGAGDAVVLQEKENAKGETKLEYVPLYKVLSPHWVNLQFNTVGFIPFGNDAQRKNVSPRVFNLFNGFEGYLTKTIAPDSKLIIDTFIYHLNIMCSHDPESFNFIINWMSHLLQFPADKQKCGVTLVFRSPQGTGKNILWEFFGEYIIGMRYYKYFNRMEQLMKNFNSIMENSIFWLLDEVSSFGGGNKDNDYLKSLTTQKTYHLEKKGIDPELRTNYSRSVMLTNNEWAVKVEKSDRRFACFEVSDEKIGKKEYFDDFAKIMYNDAAGKVIYDYLMSRDISSFKASRIPMTKFRKELMAYSGAVTDEFIKYLATDDYKMDKKISTWTSTNKEKGCINIWPKDLYVVYRNWVKQTNVHSSQELTYLKFNQYLKGFDSNIVKHKKMRWQLGDISKAVPTVIINVKNITIDDNDYESDDDYISDDNDSESELSPVKLKIKVL